VVTSDPRREAFERVGHRFDARVLEPSPPAVNDPPFWADDPVAAEPRDSRLPLLSPVPNGALTWDELAYEEPDLAEFCADRWLGTWRPLLPIPDPNAFARTRNELHAVAEQVLAPARRRANGKIGLRFTRAGFGTPFFDEGRQVRVERGNLVVVHGGLEERATLTTVNAAARLVGIEPGAPADLYHPATDVPPDAPLAIGTDAAELLGDWFGFACSVLEELRVGQRAGDTRTQLWPEHFDLSVDLGDEPAGTRGTFGASPGDLAHAEPYLYVTHWRESAPADPYWNDTAFAGASLPYSALVGRSDHRSVALVFFRTGLDVLGVPHE
jgi:hypothetical protein